MHLRDIVMALLFSTHVFLFCLYRHANWLPQSQEPSSLDWPKSGLVQVQSFLTQT